MNAPDFLYEFLPTIYRQLDLRRDMPLQALFTILQEQHDVLESDIAKLYDNWFVETCEPWALPYIADLLGADRFRHDVGGIDKRRLTANTLAYSRRKGIVATIEHVAEDATGWSARVVEGIDLMAMTETARRPRRRGRGTISVRDTVALDRLGGAFEHCGRTAQIRARELSNLDRVGIFLWRLQSYPMRLVEAAALGSEHDRFTFHPLGLDMRLFNRRLGRYGINRRNGMRNVSAPLSRRLLADELARPHATGPGDDCFLLAETPAFAIYLLGPTATAIPEPVPPSQLAIGDLDHWRHLAAAKDARVMVDPERGRLMLLSEADRRGGTRILTDHCYGLAGDVGGGPYFHPATPFAAAGAAWRARVDGFHIDSAGDAGESAGAGDAGDAGEGDAGDAGEIPGAGDIGETGDAGYYASLGAALRAWAASGKDGTLEIVDSGSYRLDGGDADRVLSSIVLAGGQRSLTIQAAPNQRPCLKGTLVIDATATDADAAVTLDGLMIDGAIHTRGGVNLTLRHCTVIPSHGHISVLAAPDASAGLHVVLHSCMTAGLRLPADASGLKITHSIINGVSLRAIAAPERGAGGDDGEPAELQLAGPPSIVTRSTLIGSVVVAEIQASDSIFTAPLAVTRQHQGFVRYCYVAAGSRTPRRYECWSDAHEVAGTCGADDPAIGRRIRPKFTSLHFGHPGYAQLAAACPREILAGASNGAEIGAFNGIDDIRRQDNLRDMLDEHLPVGYRPVTFYVT
jgi:hypothetical protein